MRRNVIAISIGLVLGCDDAPRAQEACAGAAPVCLDACGSDVGIAPSCTASGEWVCNGGVDSSTCETPCEGTPDTCITACDGDDLYDATCEGGRWSCGEDVVADTCALCEGEPSPCIEACGSEVVVGETLCEDEGWTCARGVATDSCAPCEGEEPLECVVSCEEGEIYEATCTDDAWDCGDGTPLDGCVPTCDATSGACEESCGGAEPWLCVPSCEVFEIYEATCTGEQWSCGDGVLAAEC